MKKIIILFIAIITTLPSFSQDFESGDINKKYYVRLGLSTPLWTYYGFQNKQALEDVLSVKSRVGANFEVGAIFMLNGINIGDGFGINVDFISFKAQVLKLEEDGANIYNGFAGSKIGPSFTYAINKAIAFDVFAKINPIWGATVYYNQQNINEDFNLYYGYLQMMYSFGFNMKLGIVMLGFEYDMGKLHLKNNNSDGYWDPTYSNDNGPWDPETNPQLEKTSVPMDGFNVTIGIVF